jgi:hypothetical protein
VERKDSFDSDAKAGFANRNCLAGAAVFACDANSLEGLQSFLGFRFLNPDVDTHSVTRLKIRNIIAQLVLFNTI